MKRAHRFWTVALCAVTISAAMAANANADNGNAAGHAAIAVLSAQNPAPDLAANASNPNENPASTLNDGTEIAAFNSCTNLAPAANEAIPKLTVPHAAATANNGFSNCS